jgi:hypothetical protein
VGLILEHFAAEALGGTEIAAGREQDVERLAVLVDGAVHGGLEVPAPEDAASVSLQLESKRVQDHRPAPVMERLRRPSLQVTPTPPNAGTGNHIILRPLL